MPVPRFHLVLLFALAQFVVHPAEAAEIRAYGPTFIPGRAHDDGPLLLAVRTLMHDGVPHFLVVDTQSLKTALLAADAFLARDNPDSGRGGYIPWEELRTSPYWQALQAATEPQPSIQNHGLTHARRDLPGYVLTADMCPSRRPMERAMFEGLAIRRAAPVPVAICITGVWLLTHAEDMRWLQQQAAGGGLEITWVNHTFSHIYFPDQPIDENFLLRPEVHIDRELLDTERLLLEHDVLPSIFVRFPGLVSDAALLARTRHLGLIPLGSDAWLAKGEQPTRGSVILVHGNGNEPQGIEALMDLIADPATQWRGLEEAAAR